MAASLNGPQLQMPTVHILFHAHQRRSAVARGGDINDVVVPLLLVLQLERVPATLAGYG